MAKIHLAKGAGAGGRSVCRYTSRPSRRVQLLPLAAFTLLSRSSQCSDCAAKASALVQQEGAKPTVVYHLEAGEEVHCYYCLRDRDYTLYKRGDAYLADPGHSPCDGNANFICSRHLDEGAVVYEPSGAIE
jgi:hypothetical protein